MADSDQPRGRKRLRPEVPRTPDAVDIALERSDDETARTLLGKHTELLEAQIASERLDHSSKRMANGSSYWKPRRSISPAEPATCWTML